MATPTNNPHRPQHLTDAVAKRLAASDKTENSL